MMAAVRSVLRGEGLASAMRRAGERVEEAAGRRLLLARGAFASTAHTEVINLSAAGTAARLGGVSTQLRARLQAERALRNVALLAPGLLQLSAPFDHARRLSSFAASPVDLLSADFESAVRQALELTGARAIHLEGTNGVPLGSVLRLIESGIELIVGAHDFSLFCSRPHLMEQPVGEFCRYSTDYDRCHRCLRESWPVSKEQQVERRSAARHLLSAAKAVVFPSPFLRDRHGELFSLPQLAGTIIEPGVSGAAMGRGPSTERRAIAYAGSVKRHKGGHLLPLLAQLVDRPVHLHIFGGGDEDLLRALRRCPNVTVHGYYRASLPALLSRHGVGLVVLPSIVPETYGLALSEAWQAGAAAVAFDLGAVAERIRHHGGGWLAPVESGAAGLAAIVERWLGGQLTATIPDAVPTAATAAARYVALYRQLGLLSRDSGHGP
jgi:glycosyltransferase involved in cell wall biosynthesis